MDQLTLDEEEAHTVRDYERAARHRAERLRLETEFAERYEAWQTEQQLDEMVDAEDIAEVVAAWTGIPLTQMLETEAEKLLNMEDRLHERIVGQNRAIEVLSDAIRRSRSGLERPAPAYWLFHILG